MGGHGSPIFALPGQVGGVNGALHTCRLNVRQRPAVGNRLQLQGAADDEEVTYFCPLQAPNHHALIADIASKALLAQTMQRLSNRIA